MLRRELLMLGAAGVVAAAKKPIPVREGVPRIDYHAHLEEGMTIDRAIAISIERGVKFGLVQHAGVKTATSSASQVTNDTELGAWIRSLEGKPAFKGIQAEHLDWMSAFSKDAVAKL